MISFSIQSALLRSPTILANTITTSKSGKRGELACIGLFAILNFALSSREIHRHFFCFPKFILPHQAQLDFQLPVPRQLLSEVGRFTGASWLCLSNHWLHKQLGIVGSRLTFSRHFSTVLAGSPWGAPDLLMPGKEVATLTLARAALCSQSACSDYAWRGWCKVGQPPAVNVVKWWTGSTSSKIKARVTPGLWAAEKRLGLKGQGRRIGASIRNENRGWESPTVHEKHCTHSRRSERVLRR